MLRKKLCNKCLNYATLTDFKCINYLPFIKNLFIYFAYFKAQIFK